MGIIDTHAHYDNPQFDRDRLQVLPMLWENGIEAVIDPGASLESNDRMRALFGGESRFYFAVGIHPNAVKPAERHRFAGYMDHLRQLAREKTVAVGETGLDYFRNRDPEQRALQKEVFRLHIDLAAELGLPLILHVRQAAQDALEILEGYGRGFSGVAHCFTEGLQTAWRYLDLGFALGLGGSVTKQDPDLRRAVEEMPDWAVLLETDAPYMAPAGSKGRNTSLCLYQVAERIARLRGRGREEIIGLSNENAKRIFRLGGT